MNYSMGINDGDALNCLDARLAQLQLCKQALTARGKEPRLEIENNNDNKCNWTIMFLLISAKFIS